MQIAESVGRGPPGFANTPFTTGFCKLRRTTGFCKVSKTTGFYNLSGRGPPGFAIFPKIRPLLYSYEYCTGEGVILVRVPARRDDTSAGSLAWDSGNFTPPYYSGTGGGAGDGWAGNHRNQLTI